jgi:oligopeptide transport system substrate-binding protein
MTNPTSRRRAALGVLAVATLLLGACSSSSDDSADTIATADSSAADTTPTETTPAETTAATPTAAAAPAKPSANPAANPDATFSYGTAEPAGIDPALVGDAYGFELMTQVFDGLTAIGPDLAVVPAVATSWTRSDDGRTWTFTLGTTSKFSNGRTVVASDFATAFNRAADPDLASPSSYQGLPIEGWEAVMSAKASGAVGDQPISGVKVVDDTTMSITTTEPFTLLPKVLTHPIFSPVPGEELDTPDKAKAFAERPIGNGPYQLAAPWERTKRIVLERNAESSTPGGVARIEARFFTSTETAYRSVQAGELDASEVPANLLAQARKDTPDLLAGGPLPAISYFGFRTATKPYDNAELRRAISLAIDRATIAETFGGVGLTTFVAPSTPLVNSTCDAVTFDPAKAKELYAASGGLPGDVIEVSYPAGGPDEPAIKAAFNDLRNNLGLEVKITTMEFAPFVEALNGGTLAGLHAIAWVWDYPSAYSFLSPLHESTSSSNATQYKNPAFDEQMAAIRTSADEAAGAPAIGKALEMLCTDMPIVPLFSPDRILAHRAGISGLGVDGIGAITLGSVTVAS